MSSERAERVWCWWWLLGEHVWLGEHVCWHTVGTQREGGMSHSRRALRLTQLLSASSASQSPQSHSWFPTAPILKASRPEPLRTHPR
jgi:hypothetical protein